MRISGWSSDVCSSDLVPARIMFSAAFAARQAEANKRDPHPLRHDRAEVTDPREQERGSNKPRAERDVDEAQGASDFGGCDDRDGDDQRADDMVAVRHGALTA